MDNFILWLGGSSVAVALLMGWLKKFVKDVVSPRFGDLGVLFVLYAISLIIAVAGLLLKVLPADWVKVGSEIAVGALAIYQILWKAVVNKAILGRLDKNEK